MVPRGLRGSSTGPPLCKGVPQLIPHYAERSQSLFFLQIFAGSLCRISPPISEHVRPSFPSDGKKNSEGLFLSHLLAITKRWGFMGLVSDYKATLFPHFGEFLALFRLMHLVFVLFLSHLQAITRRCGFMGLAFACKATLIPKLGEFLGYHKEI